MKYEMEKKGGGERGEGEKNLISSQLRDQMKLILRLGENLIFFLSIDTTTTDNINQ